MRRPACTLSASERNPTRVGRISEPCGLEVEIFILNKRVESQTVPQSIFQSRISDSGEQRTTCRTQQEHSYSKPRIQGHRLLVSAGQTNRAWLTTSMWAQIQPGSRQGLGQKRAPLISSITHSVLVFPLSLLTASIPHYEIGTGVTRRFTVAYVWQSKNADRMAWWCR